MTLRLGSLIYFLSFERYIEYSEWRRCVHIRLFAYNMTKYGTAPPNSILDSFRYIRALFTFFALYYPSVSFPYTSIYLRVCLATLYVYCSWILVYINASTYTPLWLLLLWSSYPLRNASLRSLLTFCNTSISEWYNLQRGLSTFRIRNGIQSIIKWYRIKWFIS